MKKNRIQSVVIFLIFGALKLQAIEISEFEETILSYENRLDYPVHSSEQLPIESFSQYMDSSENQAEKSWKIGGTGGFNFSQGYLSYWAEGGESSISGLTFLSLEANYQKGNSKWENRFSSKYGMLKSGENKLRKNEDSFEISSKFGQKAYKNFYYSVLVSLKSQIAKGYEFPNDSVVVSDFMSPGYVVSSIGMDYKPTDKLSILMSPLTSKITVMNDTTIKVTKYGLEKGETNKKEMGAYIKTRYKIDITDDITLENELDFFTNYRDKPENIDVNWEVKVVMKVNAHINTTIQTHLIYDDDINLPIERTRPGDSGPETYLGTTKKIQFKEMLSVGFSYKF